MYCFFSTEVLSELRKSWRRCRLRKKTNQSLRHSRKITSNTFNSVLTQSIKQTPEHKQMPDRQVTEPLDKQPSDKQIVDKPVLDKHVIDKKLYSNDLESDNIVNKNDKNTVNTISSNNSILNENKNRSPNESTSNLTSKLKTSSRIASIESTHSLEKLNQSNGCLKSKNVDNKKYKV